MHCVEQESPDPQRRQVLGAMGALAALAAGCASPPAAAPAAPPPAPAPARPSAAAPAAAAPRPAPAVAAPLPAPAAPEPAPRSGVDLGPRVNLPPAPAVRNWDDFKKMAARRMVAARPQGSYMGKPPPLLFGIPIIEIEVNADGSVRNISVVRPPANSEAANTLDYAIEAVRRGGPYGEVSKLPKPWKWTEVFLFNDKRQFKPRSLD